MRITNQHTLSAEQRAADPIASHIEADFWRELQELEAEAIGWTELAPGTYLHTAREQGPFIEIVGVASANMAAENVLWLL